MREPAIPIPEAGAAAALAALLRRAARGEEAAWREVVDLYASRLFALARARGLSAELSEEIAHATLVRVAEHLREGRYEESGRFESWIFSIAINRVRDEARRRSRQATPVDPSSLRLLESAPPHAADSADPHRFAPLRAALATLSEADHEVVSLRHHAGMAFAQIADVLQEPVGTVLARHHRALRKLKTILAPEGDVGAKP